MAEFSAQSKKLVELFNSIREEPKKFWNVPDYQRDFTWKEEQFKEFWEDLHAEHESAFFGDLLFKDEDNEHEQKDIIDGQQRLTTISIFVSVIANMIGDLKNRSYIKKDPEAISYISTEENDIRRDFLDRFKLITKGQYEHNFYLRIQSKYQDLFEKFILKKDYTHSIKDIDPRDGTYHPNFLKNYPLRNIQDAYIYFYTTIESWDDYRIVVDDIEKKKANYTDKINVLKSLLDKLRKFQIIHVQAREESLAYEYFEAVNARGVDLTVSDLLKNLILKEIKLPENATKAKDNFSDAINNIKEFDESNNAIGKFFRYFWCSTQEYVPQKQLYKKIKIKTKKSCKNDNDWVNFTKQIKEYSRTYRNLLDSSKDKENFEQYFTNHLELKKIYKTIFGLKSSNTELWTVICMTIFDKHNFKYLKENSFPFYDFLEALEKMIFSYSVVSKKGSNEIWTFVEKISSRLRYCKQYNYPLSGKNSINSELNTHYFSKILKDLIPVNEEFVEGASKNIKYTKKTTRLIKYYLGEIERVHFKNNDYSRSNTEVEHIIPQKPMDYFGLYAKDVTGLHYIGNLMLIESGHNKKIKNYNFDTKKTKSGNKIPKTKRQLYKDSAIKQVSQGFFKKSGEFKYDFDKITKNNLKPIEKRKESIIKIMTKIWIDDLRALCNHRLTVK